MPNLICELAPWEAQLWREKGIKPDCKDHGHVSKMDACEKTCHGDFRENSKAIASWVGPRAIVLTADRIWQCTSWNEELRAPVDVWQLVPGTAEPQSKPPQPEQFKPRGLPSIRARVGTARRRSLAFSIPTST